MISAFAKALEQLPEPAFRGVLLKSLGLTIALYVSLLWLGFAVVPGLVAVEGWWSWLQWLAEFAGLIGFAVAAFLLFPAVSTLFVSLFLEDIVRAVEARHYGQDAAGRSPAAMTSFSLSLRYTVVALSLNLLASPIYLIGLIFPPVNIVVFYGLNGYLLGREYFELVGSRHLAPKALRELRKSASRRLWLAGVAIAFLLTVPIVNLVAPLLATAAMVHLLKDLQARHAS